PPPTPITRSVPARRRNRPTPTTRAHRGSRPCDANLDHVSVRGWFGARDASVLPVGAVPRDRAVRDRVLSALDGGDTDLAGRVHQEHLGVHPRPLVPAV